MSNQSGFTSKDGKTNASITHVSGGGNSSGGYISVGGQVSHQVGPNTSVNAGGQVNHSQSFNGGGGNTSWSGNVGITHRF